MNNSQLEALNWINSIAKRIYLFHPSEEETELLMLQIRALTNIAKEPILDNLQRLLVVSNKREKIDYINSFHKI